jgi:hypothetical protein
MANELSLSFTLSFNKANCQRVTQSLASTVTVSGTYVASSTQLIGTSDETLTFPSDLATVGYCLFQNLDPTNFILIGNDGAVYPIKLLAGEIALLRFTGTVHAKSDTGACKLGFTIIEA